MERTYRHDLDLLKGWAILAVVLYHLGVFESGYLGVDVFLVVNGFLLVPSAIRQVQADKFSIWTFFTRRLSRLLPLATRPSTTVGERSGAMTTSTSSACQQ